MKVVANEEKSWLADDKVLTHFESLKFENTETVHTDVGKDEKGLEDSDIEGAELPLGKMIKRLKSQRTKKKKVVRKHSLPVGGNNTENDVDILGTSKKIKLDNQERATKLEYGKLGNGHERFITGETANQNGKKKSSESRKKRKTSDVFSTPVPTRKRSPFGKDTHRQPRSRNSVKRLGKTSRASSNSIGISSMQSLEIDEELHDLSEVKLSKDKSMVEPTESDFSLSQSPTTKSSSRHKKKGIVRHLNDMGDSETLSHEPEESSLLLETDEKNSVGNFKSSMGTNKKRKRRSIARLAKCSTKISEKHDSELVGCRVKVWWPIDKQFYEGVVQSYNPGKKKHVILYDDGDMEVLQLDKEQWEVVSEGSEPSKRLKSSNVSPPKRMSAKEEKSRTPGASRRNKNSSKKFRRKTTTKKNVKNSHSGISESNIGADASDYTERRATPDLSDSYPDISPKVNEVNSDDSAEEQASPSEAAEEEPEAPTDPKESDREEKMDSFDRGATGDSDDEPLSMWKLRGAQVA